MRSPVGSRVARRGRSVGLAVVLASVGGCGAPAVDEGAEPDSQPPARAATLETEIIVDRWHGQVVERHPQFVRVDFEGAVVELSPRGPGREAALGSETIAVQPAPGARVSPELLEAVGAWVQRDEARLAAWFDASASVASGPEPRSEPAPDAPQPQRGPGLGLLAIWAGAAIASLVAWARGRDRVAPAEPTTTHESESRWLIVAGPLLAAVAALGLRLIVAAPTPLHDDALRDLAMGVGCFAGDPCVHGATTSFGGFEQGTGFPRMLGLLRVLGLGIPGLQTTLMVLFALAIAVAFDAGRRLAGPGRGAVGGALAAVALLGLLLTELTHTGEILWNPAAMALPAALAQAALLRGAATGRAGMFLLAGLFAGLAFESHVAGLALWPGLVIVAAATASEHPRADRPPPTPAALAHRLVWLPTLAGALAVPMLLSPMSAVADARLVIAHIGWPACVGAGLATVALGFVLRRWLERAPSPARAQAVAVAVPIATLVGALVLAGGFVDAHPARYLAPVFPAVALSGAWLATLALARVPAPRPRAIAATLAAGLILALTMPAYVQRMALDRDRWNYADVDQLAAFLRDHGVSQDEVHYTARGALCGRESHGDRGQRHAELLVAALRTLGELDHEPPPAPGPAVPSAWLVAKLRDAELPALPESFTTLASGASHTIVLAPYQPVADLAAIRYCVRAGDEPPHCVPAVPQAVRPAARQVLPRHDYEPALEPDATAYYELPLRWPAAAATTRHTTVQLHARADSQAWRIVAVEGADFGEQSLPATTLELSLAPGASATLTLALVTAPGHEPPHPDAWWPPLVEVPAELEARALFLLD